MKLTTGYEFQGYFITEYLDVIFDEMLVGLGFSKSVAASFDNLFSALSGSEATEMVDKLNSVKCQLRERVISKAKKLGANALIGIDFESSKLGDLIMVSMTATAVKIDKIISPLPCTQAEQDQKDESEKTLQEAEVRQQRLDYIQKHPAVFNKEVFWNALNGIRTTKEMVEFIQNVANKHPDIFDENFVSSIRKHLQIERLYGDKSGKTGVLKTVKEFLDIQ